MLMVCWPSSPRSALSNIQLWYCKQPDSRPVYHVKKHNARHVNFSLTMTAEETDRVRSQGSFFMVAMKTIPKSLLQDPIMIFRRRRMICGSSPNGRSNSNLGQRFQTFYTLKGAFFFAVTNLILKVQLLVIA
jgi:hypothetical protein